MRRLRDLASAPWIDGPIALAVQDKHRCANLRELVAHDRAEAAKLVDAAGGTHAVAVQLLDGVGIPEVDVVTGVVPANDALDDR